MPGDDGAGGPPQVDVRPVRFGLAYEDERRTGPARVAVVMRDKDGDDETMLLLGMPEARELTDGIERMRALNRSWQEQN